MMEVASVEGPLFSLRARGSIHNLLTFQTTTAGQICKGYKIPRDPRSQRQLTNRSHFKQAAAYYSTLSTTDRQAWKVRTYEEPYTGYAGFIKQCKRALDRGLTWINITGIEIEDISLTTATIYLQTTQPVGIRILYGYSPGNFKFEKTEQEPYTKTPAIQLTDLFLRTDYHLTAQVIDTTLYAGETGHYQFTTGG